MIKKMFHFVGLSSASFLVICIFNIQTGFGQASKIATAREIMVKMATSREGFPNPNTPFLESGGRDEDLCYPVPFKPHVIREKPVEIDWRIVVLENDYLRVEFAPELGGMIWRMYDKVHGIDALHAPGKVSPTADGFGGSYTPGGIEFNYPYAHSVTNTWPRKTEYRQNKDGSATYIVSEWERNGRTEWSIEFTLRPGEGRLVEEVTLFNRSKLPAGFVYWGNSRVPANADTRWIEPEAMSSEHGGSNIFTWPVFRDVDLSLMINDPEVIGMYFLEPRYNFFGLTNLKTKSGMVHYADRHDVPGKKLWNWGRTPMDGNRKWDPAQRSGSEPHYYGYEYGEVQSGRMVNQDHLEWLWPEECIIWQEAWSPIFGLSNVSEVTEDAVFQLNTEERKLLVYPLTMADDMKLLVFAGGKLVKELPIKGKTYTMQEIDLKDISGDLNDLDIKVEKSGARAGNISAISRCEQKKASELREVPLFSECSTESLASWAEFDHKLLHRNSAMERYQQSIGLDSLNFRACLGLGKLLLANADFDGARKEFLRAISAYKWAGEAYLMLAHIDHLQGDLVAAEEHAYEARYYGEKCRGNLKLGEVMIAMGEYDKAKKVLEEALVNNGRSLRTYALLAMCDRKMGNTKLALADLSRSPSGALKDLMWYSEAWLAGQINEKELQKELFSDEWRYLELGINYLELGAFREADKLADAGISLHRNGWELDKLFNPDRMWNFARKRENPFLYLIKGEAARRQGKLQEASAMFRMGDYFEYQVNFNQMELVPVLKAAAAAGNGYAGFWLGNFYYHNMRPDEANAEWTIAAAKHPDNPQIIRNLAVYSRYQLKDPWKSSELLREALRINPADLFIRQELVASEKAIGSKPDDILGIYLDAPKEQRDSYLYQHGLLQAFKDAGKWDDAAEYLKGVDRHWSDDPNSWYYFCIGYADYLLENGQPEESLKWIGKSSQTPANLSNVNLPSDYFYRQEEYYITGLAYKEMGDTTKSLEFFRKVVNEPTDFLFNESAESRIQQLRYYVALALKELGMNPVARGILNSINEYRLKRGLIVLKLEKSELNKWNRRDQLAEIAPSEH